jgi:ribosomal protein S18 acetylase RimI-like enzyme
MDMERNHSHLRIIQANLDCPEHARDIVALTNAYASDEMGNSAPLPSDVLDRLVPALRAHPTTIIFLAYLGQEPVGIATCFLGFSTFAAKPLINIHDLAVVSSCRGKGVGRALLEAVAQHARERGCVKVTLEVQENNTRARKLYESAGFAQMVYGTHTGGSLYYSRNL